MTFDYIYHLTNEEVKTPSSSKQWASKYNWYVAHGQKKEQADPLRDRWKNLKLQNRQTSGEEMADQNWQTNLTLSPTPATLPILDSLPTYTFLLHFTFTLAKPYLSRDDTDFHIIDNPVVRDKVFRWPMVRPSGWKGALCHALWQSGHDKADDPQTQRIFGDIRDDERGQSGRLYFYPTFFTQTGLEIINPHDRTRRVGTNPILLESVPAGATGTFTLLYAPFDRIGEDEPETRRQVADDLKLLAEGVQALFTLYGFGAKTSSGFGLASEQFAGDGVMVVGGLHDEAESPRGETPPSALPQPALARYLAAPDKLHPDFVTATGALKSESEYRYQIEARGQKYGKKDKQLYDKAKGWWEREGQQLAQLPAPEPAPSPAAPAPTQTRRTFTNFAALVEQTQAVAEMIRQEMTHE